MHYEAFDIRKSTKAHIDSPEHFVVVRNGTVYLRVVGQEGSYVVMTATAGEDLGTFFAFGDQTALNEAAFEVAKQVGSKPILRQDFHERSYVEVCGCEFLSDAYRAAVMLFEELAQQQARLAEP